MSQKPTYEELEQRIRELEHAESELKRSNDEIMKFRAIADKAVHGNAIADLDGTIVYLNDFFARVHGYTPDDLIGKDLSVFHNEKQLVDVRRINENLIKNGSYNALEVWHTHKDGTEFPMLMNAVVIYDGNGVPMYLGATGIDITERKRAEQALKNNQNFLNRIINQSPFATWISDEKGTIIKCNAALTTFLNITAEQLIDKYNVFEDEVAIEQGLIPKIRTVFEDGKTANFSVEWDANELGYKDAKKVHIEGTMFPIHDDKGDLINVVNHWIDITERKRAEEASRESHKRYQLIVENISNVVWTMDMNFHNTFVSPSVYQQRGYTPEEVKNQPLSERMNPNSIEKVLNLYNEKLKLIEAGDSEGWKPIEFEIEQPCKDGSTIWTTNTVRLLPGPDKQPASFLGTTHDITERKLAEEALRESEAQKAAILDGISTNLAFVNEDLEILWANKISAESVNRNVDEIIGHKCYELWADPNAPCDGCPTAKAFQTKKTEQTIIHSPDGRVWEEKGEPVFDEKGGLIGVLEIAHDITAKARAEDALRDSEERYRLLVENQTDMIVKFDADGHLTFVSQSYCKTFGKSEDELLGKKFIPLIHEEDREAVVKALDKVHRPPYIAHVEERAMTKDGWRWQAWLNTAVLNEKNEVEATVAVGRDINKQKQVEEERIKLEAQLQQAQKMEAIGTLAGGVAHDLNNILGGLVSYPELLLLQLPEDSPLRKSILTIQKSGEKAAAVVQDLLTLARRGVVTTEVVNLNNVIAEYLQSPEHENLQSVHPGVHMETHLEKDTLNVLGSSTHLSKTVMNLVSNAAEAMPEGGNLIVSTENRYIDRPISGYGNVKEGDYVVFTISDTGTGISPDDIGKIFEPFYTKKKMGRSGTGLGMAVVWGTVKDHNGYIDVQSTEGKGTTFTLYFPVTRKSVEERSEISLKDYIGKGETILVVDDVEEQRQIASGMLKELGYSVVSVSSGEEAVEYLKINKADVLLLDMIMDPGMDGLDTYKKVLELHPGQKAIITSGFSETDHAKELQSLGAGAYIRKPFLLEKIGLAVKKELGK